MDALLKTECINGGFIWEKTILIQFVFIAKHAFGGFKFSSLVCRLCNSEDLMRLTMPVRKIERLLPLLKRQF